MDYINHVLFHSRMMQYQYINIIAYFKIDIAHKLKKIIFKKNIFFLIFFHVTDLSLTDQTNPRSLSFHSREKYLRNQPPNPVLLSQNDSIFLFNRFNALSAARLAVLSGDDYETEHPTGCQHRFTRQMFRDIPWR